MAQSAAHRIHVPEVEGSIPSPATNKQPRQKMEFKAFTQKFVTDSDKEQKGVELHIGEGFYVKVARSGNPRATAMFRELTSDPQFAVARRSGLLSDEKYDEVIFEVYSNTILVGWRGLTDNGADVPYSREKAKELLRHKDFFAIIKEFSETQENYRTEAVEGAAELLGKQ